METPAKPATTAPSEQRASSKQGKKEVKERKVAFEDALDDLDGLEDALDGLDTGAAERRRLAEIDRQFGAISGVALDAQALATLHLPSLTERTGSLVELADEARASYHTTPLQAKGVLLADALATLTRLFELGRTLEGNPRLIKNKEDPLAHYRDLMAPLRGCIKFVSDELAAYALALVQSEDGIKLVVSAELVGLDREQDLIARDEELARSLHDRDAEYAARGGYASYAPPAYPAHGGAHQSYYSRDPLYDPLDLAYDPPGRPPTAVSNAERAAALASQRGAPSALQPGQRGMPLPGAPLPGAPGMYRGPVMTAAEMNNLIRDLDADSERIPEVKALPATTAVQARARPPPRTPSERRAEPEALKSLRDSRADLDNVGYGEDDEYDGDDGYDPYDGRAATYEDGYADLSAYAATYGAADIAELLDENLPSQAKSKAPSPGEPAPEKEKDTANL